MKRISRYVAVLCLVASLTAAKSAAGKGPESLSVDAWARVLDGFVSAEGVDYGALVGNRQDLDLFLESLATFSAESLDGAGETAFWINAYNASVVALVLERYPGLSSVMDVDGFFDRLRVRVAGRDLTLDEIEARALAGNDARVHFAVVCAAQSCPALRNEPYTAESLDNQLEDQTRGFVADTLRGASYDDATGVLSLSTLFKWYGGDFTGGTDVGAFLLRGRVRDWVRPYLPEETRRRLGDANATVRYIEYDWRLNDSQTSARGEGG